MSLASDFGLLFILEARDRASEIFDRVDEALGHFSTTAKSAADIAREAGSAIDDSLLQTASGADALDLADARVSASQARAAQATADLATAEQALLDAQHDAALAADDDTQATSRLMEASTSLAAAQRESAVAAKGLSDAQKLQADTAAAAAAKSDAAADSQDAASNAAKDSSGALSGLTKVSGLVALGMAAAGYETVKMAGNFQDATTHLVTDAGESASNLQMVQAGILKVSTATGTSASAITDAMYHIESAGYHGASGLKLLQVAAEGAKVGGADLDTVSKTLVGTMRAYGPSIGSANQVMNMLIATVGQGDMRMSDLASALSTVAPTAAKAGIPFSQLGAAIATMTAQGMTADQATQDLNASIGSLMDPTNVQTQEMQQLGLSSNKLSAELGHQGLTATMTTLTRAVASHVKGGQVWLSTYQSATQATANLKTMMGSMPPAFRSMAQGYLSGTVSASQWRTELQAQTPLNQHMLQQFASLADKTKSFNSQLISGSPASQTINAAWQKLTGTQAGLRTALMLTGSNAGDFAKSAENIRKQAGSASSGVAGWSTIQGTFNFKMQQAKTAAENTGIAIGSALLPAVSSLLSGITRIVTPIAEWTARHRGLTEALFVGVGAIAATVAIVGAAAKAYKAITGTISTVKSAASGAQAAMQKLGLISKKTADQQAASAKSAAKAQEAASEEAAATQEESAGEAAAATETAAGETAAANEEAAAESSSSWIASAASQVAAAASWVASGAAKVAAYVATNVAGAASTAGAWIAQQASQVAAGAVWVAQGLAKVAIFVATNVTGAVATGVAWMAANAIMLLGIGLVIAAVVAAVILIVTHWRQISAAVAEVWHDVLSFISTVVDDVISFVKSHWPLLLVILTGPLGMAVVAVVKYWHDIQEFFSRAISAIVDFVRSHWPLILAIATGGLSLLVSEVARYWGDIEHWFDDGVSEVLSILRGLASNVVSIGRDVVTGLWNGISGAAGWLMSQVRGFASSVISSLGSAFGIGSPSKLTTVHGLMLGAGLAGGLIASLPKVLSAARQVAATALSATSGFGASGRTAGTSLGASSASLAAIPAGGGSGAITLVVNINDAHIMNDGDIRQLVSKLGPPLVKMLAQAGRKVTYP